jgi:hypothetical protein
VIVSLRLDGCAAAALLTAPLELLMRIAFRLPSPNWVVELDVTSMQVIDGVPPH